MCGRASYSARAVRLAALTLGTGPSAASHRKSESGGHARCVDAEHYRSSYASADNPAKQEKLVNHSVLVDVDEITNNSNMSPGNTPHVFRRRPSSDELECIPMTWGLIPQNGTPHSPHHLPSDPRFSSSPHFKMFNARSETLYEKRSFSGLIRNGQTCIFAVDGYYEWTMSQSLSDKRKQPYYVCRKDKTPILLAGLWCCVETGNDVTLTTFTILTTDAHPTLSWLHPRQPVIIWEDSIALQWLLEPNPTLLSSIRSIPIEAKTSLDRKPSPWETQLHVYPVTKKMNDGKYHGDDCTKEVKLGSTPSLKSFFSVSNTDATATNPPGKLTSVEKRSLSESSHRPQKGDLALEDAERDNEIEPSWTCAICTFEHNGEPKSKFLTCEVCGAKRNKDLSKSDDTGVATTSVAWGSLQSRSMSSVKKRKI
ncbi:hypothetical protein ACHAWX_005301 [Stephanocyclus meneghinianus]